MEMDVVQADVTSWKSLQDDVVTEIAAAAKQAGQPAPRTFRFTGDSVFDALDFLRSGDADRAILIDAHGKIGENDWQLSRRRGSNLHVISAEMRSPGEWSCRAAIVWACTSGDSEEDRKKAFQQLAKAIGPESFMLVCVGLTTGAHEVPRTAAVALAKADPHDDVASLLGSVLEECRAVGGKTTERARQWLLLEVRDYQLTQEAVDLVQAST